MKKVKDFMTKKVICFSPEDTIFKVAEVFAKRKISGAPVLKNGKVVGIISVSDIVKFINMKVKKSFPSMPSLSLLALFLIKSGKDFIEFKKNLKKIADAKIEKFMSKKVVWIEPEASIFDAAYLMQKHDVNRLPVIKNGKLVGIITREDLVRALVD